MDAHTLSVLLMYATVLAVAVRRRAGYLKFASRAAWTLVRFEYFDVGRDPAT